MNARQEIHCFLYLLLVLIITKHANAQNKKIEITYEQTENGYDFYAENQNQAPYLVKVTFNSISNLRPSFNPKKELTVYTGRQRIFTLKKEREHASTNFNYKYSYRKGKLPVKLNPDFTYLIPLKENRLTRTLKIAYVGEMLGTKGKTPENWYGVGFTMYKADTVVAARSGEVINVIQQINQTEEHLLMSKQRNLVEILHKDGTIGLYTLFKKEGVLVKEGEQVIAGQALGIIDSEHYENGPHLRFQVYYALAKGGYAYVAPKFHVDEINQNLEFQKRYKVTHPKGVVEQELSKRQKKKRKKGKKD